MQELLDEIDADRVGRAIVDHIDLLRRQPFQVLVIQHLGRGQVLGRRDITQLVGGHAANDPRQARAAEGTPLEVTGLVLDRTGRPRAGARVEIWQCDAFGQYHHVGEPEGSGDPNFQGFGAVTANAEGRYAFRTIRPVPYPGRTPHIHFRIAGPGFEPLVTQMYIEGHPLNAEDGIYRRLGERALLVSVRLEPAPELEPQAKSGAKRALFDIVLGPNGVPRDT